MEEKYMVNDILENIKSNLIIYQGIIAESENLRFKTNYSADKR